MLILYIYIITLNSNPCVLGNCYNIQTFISDLEKRSSLRICLCCKLSCTQKCMNHSSGRRFESKLLKRRCKTFVTAMQLFLKWQVVRDDGMYS